MMFSFVNEKGKFLEIRNRIHCRDFYRAKPNNIAPDVTPQNATSHLGLFCCLEEFLQKWNKILKSNLKLHIKSRFNQMITMGKSIRHLGKQVGVACQNNHFQALVRRTASWPKKKSRGQLFKTLLA